MDAEDGILRRGFPAARGVRLLGRLVKWSARTRRHRELRQRHADRSQSWSPFDRLRGPQDERSVQENYRRVQSSGNNNIVLLSFSLY